MEIWTILAKSLNKKQNMRENCFKKTLFVLQKIKKEKRKAVIHHSSLDAAESNTKHVNNINLPVLI